MRSIPQTEQTDDVLLDAAQVLESYLSSQEVREEAVVITSAIIAVGVEVRRLTNALLDTQQPEPLTASILLDLADARHAHAVVCDERDELRIANGELRQQLAQMDADNAALIAGNGKTQPAAVLIERLDQMQESAP